MKNPEKPPGNPVTTPPKPLDEPALDARGGRPSRDEAERRRLMAAGVDHTLVDPRRILAAIAIDDEAPPGARVQAAKALLLARAGLPPDADRDEGEPDAPGDALTRRTLEILSGKGRPN